MCHRRIFISTSFQVGKYLVSPLTRRDAGGSYIASVSIRSGRGSATHDRVFRFLPVFPSRREAARYAKHQGLAWIAAPASLTSFPVIQPE
jgi:hypothetical protein